MTTAQVLILVAIAIYLLFMLWIGWICAKKNESVDDFYLGGRKLGPFVTAMSAEASDMSSWLLMSLPGVAYLTGLAEASWTAIGLVVGTYLNWLIVAKRIRRYSNRLNAITVPQFFSKQWGITAVCCRRWRRWSSSSSSFPTPPPAFPPAANCFPPCSAWITSPPC